MTTTTTTTLHDDATTTMMTTTRTTNRYSLYIRSIIVWLVRGGRGTILFLTRIARELQKGPSIKHVTLFLMIFDPLPCHKLSQILDPLPTPLKVCHTSEQKVNKQVSGKCRLPLNNFNNYYILNTNKRLIGCFLINPKIPMKV